MQRLIIHLMAHFPKIALTICVISCLAFGALAIFNLEQMINMPSEVMSIDLEMAKTLVSAGNSLPVSIDYVKWDCRNIYTGDSSSSINQILFSDDERSFLGVAMFSERKHVTCKTLPEENIMGVLMPMKESTFQRLEINGLNVDSYDLTDRMILCTFSGYENNLTGLIVCSIFAVLSMALYPMILKIREENNRVVIPERVFPEEHQDKLLRME